MRHQKKTKSLSRKVGPRKALIGNMLNSLILYEKIKTTHTKAKIIKIKIDKLITKAKQDTLANRRQLYTTLPTKNAVKKIFEVIGPRYKDRKGGYTRITKLAPRKGDNSPMSMIEFV